MKKRNITGSSELISMFDFLSDDIAQREVTLDEKQETAKDLSLAVQNLRSSLKVFSGEYYTRVGIYYARYARSSGLKMRVQSKICCKILII